jgi:hypothetical protein
LWVGATVGFAAGASTVAMGGLVTAIGNTLVPPADLFGWGFLFIFFFSVVAAPFGGACGALVGGLVAFKAAKENTRTRRQIWKRSLGFGILSSLLLSVLIVLGMLSEHSH